MPITWTPTLTTLIDVYKPNSTIFDISAVSDDILVTSVVYTVISETFPDTSFIAVDGTGVHITGDTTEEFQDVGPILYMKDGTIPMSTYEPNDIIVGDDVYKWLADPTLSKDVGITVKAEFFDISEVIVEFEEQDYTLTLYNSWDAHKENINSLMERLY